MYCEFQADDENLICCINLHSLMQQASYYVCLSFCYTAESKNGTATTVVNVSEQKLPSQQPASASLANVLVYKIHAPSRLILYKVHQLYKYMAIRSDSISVLGQRSNYSCSKGTTVVSDHILCGWHSSNNVLFDATFVSASYDLEVPVLQSITNCSTHDTEFQRISW